jgi:hypothetical protein
MSIYLGSIWIDLFNFISDINTCKTVIETIYDRWSISYFQPISLSSPM